MTHVMEMAVKNEVQNSVLPSLENITKTEAKAALNEQVGRGIAGNIQQVGGIGFDMLWASLMFFSSGASD
jgi:hypothetical protein